MIPYLSSSRLWCPGRGAAAPPEDDGVVLAVQVALVGQQVQAEEAIVAPALPNLKIGGEFPDDVFGGVVGGLVNHFYTVFIPGQGKGTGVWTKDVRIAEWFKSCASLPS